MGNLINRRLCVLNGSYSRVSSVLYLYADKISFSLWRPNISHSTSRNYRLFLKYKRIWQQKENYSNESKSVISLAYPAPDWKFNKIMKGRKFPMSLVLVFTFIFHKNMAHRTVTTWPTGAHRHQSVGQHVGGPSLLLLLPVWLGECTRNVTVWPDFWSHCDITSARRVRPKQQWEVSWFLTYDPTHWQT